MATRSASWSRPADGRASAAVAAVVATGLFLLVWWNLHRDFFVRHEISDLLVYRDYGTAMAHGLLPYRDFDVEYPPGALPFFVLPAIAKTHGVATYAHAFDGLIWTCGVLLLAFMAVALGRLGAGPLRLWGALGFAAVAPLALGSVVLTRFDLWPAALTIGALAAVLSGRYRLGHGVLGLGVAAKIFPAVLAPIFLLHVWRSRGRREALACAGVGLAVLVACFAPFLALGAHGVWTSVVRQTTRPLQIESLGSAVLLAIHHGFGLHLTMRTGSGSQNLVGSVPHDVGRALTALQLLAIAGAWLWFWRGDMRSRERLVTASAAAVCAFVAFGKVLSPQFLIWLVPLVPLVRGRRGLVASALLGAALVLTQLWFPNRYWWLVYGFHTRETVLVVARDLTLLALFGALVWPRWRESVSTVRQRE
ncbi:MAG TPA: glycosyltransferase 87 family protein [Gaiellaceae bacterium]